MTSPVTHATQGARVSRGTGILRPTTSGTRAIVVAAVVLITVCGFVLKAHSVDLSGDIDLNRLRTGLVGALATGVYHVFSPVPAVLITVVLTAVIWARSKDLRVAAAFAGVVAAIGRARTTRRRPAPRAARGRGRRVRSAGVATPSAGRPGGRRQGNADPLRAPARR